MTNEAQSTKNYFRLNGGLNSEINELNFPDGYTRDEANYELLVDGSRRRRKGLATETSAGTALTVPTHTATEWHQAYVWKNVGGDPDKEMVVYRKGNYLSFAVADEEVSGGWVTGAAQFVSMVTFETSGSTTANTDDEAVSFSQGRGYLFVTGQYIQPFYVAYDATADTYTANSITPYIRDFSDIEDGTGVASEPSGAITADHRYNLRNRGWKQIDLESYLSDVAKNPARNAIWWKGYKRALTASTDYDFDGVKSWDSTKMDSEVFGNSTAPKGSLFLNPFDTSSGVGTSAGVVVNILTGWTVSGTGSSWTVTMTTSSDHGIGDGSDFTISGNKWKANIFEEGLILPMPGSFNGTHTAITGTTASTLKFIYTGYVPFVFDSWIDQYILLGEVDTSLALSRSTGSAKDDSFRACEFHDGRLFLGGMRNNEFADTILFSQVVDSPQKLNRHYQEADPTAEKFNALTPADGGTMVIPGMGGVLNMASVRNGLLVLATSGVWEISGGQRGVFTADGYAVRKLTDNGMLSPVGFQQIEGALAYTGDGGIYIIAPNQYTGQLEATSMSETAVQTIWNQIPDAAQKRVQCSYDDALKRFYILCRTNPLNTRVNFMDTMLIFDARAGAWFKFTFKYETDNGLLTGFAISNADDTSSNKKMKFLFEASTTTVQVADFDQTSFNDWDGTNGPIPFLHFGHGAMGDFQRPGQAPIITVFSKRTETGYTAGVAGWDADNPSSTLMSAYWDWSDDPVTGKGGTTYPDGSAKTSGQQEVYRHRRQFVPASASDLDGYPVVVTRNKVRGRGRALQLRFDGATDKDSHILGFTVNSKSTRKK